MITKFNNSVSVTFSTHEKFHLEFMVRFLTLHSDYGEIIASGKLNVIHNERDQK